MNNAQNSFRENSTPSICVSQDLKVVLHDIFLLDLDILCFSLKSWRHVSPPNGKGKAGETSTAFPQGPPSSWGPLHVWVLPYCLGDSEIFEAVKKMVGMTMVTAGTMGKHMYQNMVVMDRNAGICFLVVLLQWDSFIDMMSETVQNKTVLPQATTIQVCRKNIVTSQPHAWYINIYIYL